MGTIYRAVALIGCQIKKSEVLPEKVVPGCDHGIANEDNGFCSECGKVAWKKDIVPIKEFQGDNNYSNGYSTLSGIPVFFTEYYDCIWVAGSYAIVTYDDDCPVTRFLYNYKNARQLVFKVLKPLGLWDEKSFCTWLVML